MNRKVKVSISVTQLSSPSLHCRIKITAERRLSELVTKVIRIIENSDNWIKFLSMKNTIIMYCIIKSFFLVFVIIKQVKHESHISRPLLGCSP
jgi:hypothetical protein